MSDQLVTYGLDDRVATLFRSFEHPHEQEPQLGRVVRVDRTGCVVARASGLGRARIDTASRQAGPDATPSTGDWVVIADRPGDEPVVIGILARRSTLVRRAPEDRDYREQVLAANVDVLAVTVGLDRAGSANRIERTLVLAWESGARPVVVLTKSDLCSDVQAAVAAAEKASGGVEVLVTSAVTGEGAAAVAALVAGGGTLALIGPSGAGKSSLVNVLVGGDVQRTGSVRGEDGRGRHTTTSRELFPIEGGGVLLDTPGLRSLGLLDGDEGLATTFADLEMLSAACRFADCSHETEPDCAVQRAILSGDLEARRLESYRKLLRELDRERRRENGAAAAAARRAYRQMWATRRREAAPPRFDERRQRAR